MQKVFSKITFNLSVLSALGLLTLSFAPSASAITFSNGSATINSTDKIGDSFQVFFDGNVDDIQSNALTSNAIFTFLGFKTVTVNNKTKTEATFDITLNNTTLLTSNTGDFFESRVSVLGFDLTPNPVGVGNASGTGDTRVNSGIFTNDSFGQMANAGRKEICFSEGNCSGGTDGGVSNVEGLTQGSSYLTGKFNATVAVDGATNTMTLGNFGVRYQSISGKLAGRSISGASGTGSGVKVVSYQEPKRKIPEPNTLGAIFVTGLGIINSRKKLKVSC